MPPLTCPSCQQQNADNMAFCIFCGSSLKPGNPSGRQPRIVGGTCSKCGKSDSLNNQFCIFCGTSMVPKAAEKEAPAAPVEPIKPVAPPPRPAVNKRAVASLMGIVGGVILGAAAGAGAAFVIPKPPPAVALPTAQLVLVTAKPAAQVVLSNDQAFFIGKTGDDGNFTADGLPKDKYELVLDGNRYPQPVALEEEKQTVLGGPPGPKLLSNE